MELIRENFLLEVEINNIPTQFEMDTDNILFLIKEISEGENLTFFSKITRKSDGFSFLPNDLCEAIKDFEFLFGTEALDSFIYKFMEKVDLANTLSYDLATFQGFIELEIRNYRGFKSS